MTKNLSLFDEGPPLPCPATFNLARYVLAGSGVPDEKVALTVAVSGNDPAPLCLTYGDLRDQVARAAAGLLDTGVRKGDRVVLRVGHSVDFPLLFLACTMVGAAAVPTSPLLSAAELAHIVDETEPALIITSPHLRTDLSSLNAEAIMGGEDLADFEDTGPDDLAYIIYTSGSSGRPKGVAHAHRAVWARRMMWDGWYGLTRDDRVMHAGAFNWTYTLGAGLMDPWAIGASTIIYAGPRDPGVWPALVESTSATIFAAAPGVYRQLLKSGVDLNGLANLRHALSAGETMADDTRNGWAVTNKPIYEALGMSELSTYLSSSPTHPPRGGAAGRPQIGRRLAILDDGGEIAPLDQPGNIALSRNDPGLMIGYWRDQKATDAAISGEWFLTGDMGVMDHDGYVAFLGRADDQMNALGYRVAPEEVEAALMRHPAVTGAAAVELPVRADLSIIAAFVTTESADVPTDLAIHCKTYLADYKIPKQFNFVAELPRNPNGKLRRKDLIARYGFKPNE
ncbi:MAG: class I adenylate-forming enzyme family protein [Pikeienuella sp.]